SDLINQALANLGVLAAGQTADTEDFDAVNDHVEQTLAGLDADEIVTITDDDAIPNEWFQPISVILADDAAMEFGLPGVPPATKGVDPVEEARALLRTRTRGKPTGDPLMI